MIKQMTLVALMVAMTGSSSVVAETATVPQATQIMSAEQVQDMMKQQRETFEKFIAEQKAASDAQKAHFDAIFKAQEDAAKAQMKAMVDHMEALRQHFDTVAEKTQAALEAQAEAQQRQVYGYMLGMMPEGQMKEAFKQAEAKRQQMYADMKVKHQQMMEKMKAEHEAAKAKMLERRNKAA